MEKYQLIDWYGKDVTYEEEDHKGHTKNYTSYTIYGTGLSLNEDSVAVRIVNFKPFFYVSIPEDWNKTKCQEFIIALKKETNNNNRTYIPYYMQHESPYIDVEKKCKFEGFTDNTKYKFMKLTFNTHRSFKAYARGIKLMKEKNDNTGECFSLYENTLDPLLRFFHMKNMKPSGFIEMDTVDCLDECDKEFNTDHEYEIEWCDIEPVESIKNAPLMIASYDIECDSSHGDFPLAQKNFHKLICEVHAEFNRVRLLVEQGKRHDIYFQTNDIDKRIDFIVELIYLGFEDNKYGFGTREEWNISKVFTKNGNKPPKEKIRSIVEEVFGVEDDKMLEFQEMKGPKKENIINNLVGWEKIIWGLDKDGNPPTKYYLNKYKKARDLPDWIHNKFPDLKIEPSGMKSLNIEIEGDPIIQIGTVFYRLGDPITKMERTIITLDTCDIIKNDYSDIQPIVCKTEAQVLKAWVKLINEKNPQFITGYNIFGFDFKYIYDRAVELKINEHAEFYEMGLLKDDPNNKCKLTHKQLSSSALGDNNLYYIEMTGRVLFDLQKEVQKEYNLGSYKLDNVAAEFMRGNIIKAPKAKQKKEKTLLFTDNLGTLTPGKYIKIIEFNTIGEQYYNNGQKFKIKAIKEKSKIVLILGHFEMKENSKYKWCEAKDDISPQDIFNKQKEGSKERAEIAKYCIQDCELCLHLINRFENVTRNISMGNVCYVPTSYIYLRGQSVKIYSLVVKTASNIPENTGTLIKTKFNKYMNDDDEIEEGELREEGYEGAIVLQPNGPGKDGGGIYTDRPVSVLDFASLYPSSMIERNLSHETIITEDMLLNESDKYKIEDTKSQYSKLIFNNNGQQQEFNVTRIEYDNYCYKYEKKLWRKTINENKPKVTCWFIDKKHRMGIIPFVVDTLLKQRKATKKALKAEKDPERKKILDGEQLAYKLTANSTYGQIGAKISQIYLQDIAACTTATGREHIMTAKRVVEEEYPGCKVIYGDTDSIFVDFSDWVHNHKDSKYCNKGLKDKELLKACIETADLADKVFIEKKIYNEPQHLEYEKTFWPFIQITKKRYTGDKYEFDVNKFSRTSMGLVTKRRDNAPIVKYVFGNIVEIIMKEKSVQNAVVWLKNVLLKIANGEFDMSMFIVSKTLRGHYKNPMGIAHKVLADRMGERDPGNKPATNDRIPYAYIECKEEQLKAKQEKRSFLQGDHIEHPDYITVKKLKIDYAFYITNQIQVPVSQVMELAYTPEEVSEMFSESLDILDPEIKYNKMSIQELKNICEEKGLISKGHKTDLIKYILDPENEEYKKPEPTEEDKYKKMKKAELVALCKEKEIDSTGIKTVLIGRLIQTQ